MNLSYLRQVAQLISHTTDQYILSFIICAGGLFFNMAAPIEGSAFSAVKSADATDNSVNSSFRSELREKAKKRRQLLAMQVKNAVSFGYLWHCVCGR